MMATLDKRGQIIDMLVTLGNPAGEIARPAHAAAGFAFHGAIMTKLYGEALVNWPAFRKWLMTYRK